MIGTSLNWRQLSNKTRDDDGKMKYYSDDNGGWYLFEDEDKQHWFPDKPSNGTEVPNPDKKTQETK